MKPKRKYIELRGQQIWLSHRKSRGTALVLLHGGLSNTDSIEKYLFPAFKGFEYFAYDRAGHGRSPDIKGSFHFEFQLQEAIAFLEDVVKRPAHIVGWSDGGIISLLLAIHRPDLVKSIIPIGANYHYKGIWPNLFTFTEPDENERLKYATTSPDGVETLVPKIKKMFRIWKREPQLTKRDLKKIKCPTLVMAGDDDSILHQHTIEIFENIPNAQLAILPGTSHALMKEKPKLTQSLIRDFLKNPTYPITKMPVRRTPGEVE